MSFAGYINTGSGDSPIMSTAYAYCTTASTQQQKTIQLEGLEELHTGMTVYVKFKHTNTAASPTLKVNSFQAYPLYRYGTTSPGTTKETSWYEEHTLALTYVGNAWMIAGWLNDNTKYSNATNDKAGLMTAAQKKKLDAVSFVDTLVFKEKAVLKNDWVADSETMTGYSHKAEIACAGVTEDHVPMVAFSLAQINAYFPAPVAISSAGKVTVWVRKKPTEQIKIPTIVCVRQPAGVT